MASRFKRGDKIRQIMPPPIRGRVDDFAVDRATGDVMIHISYETTEPGGVAVTHSRYFSEDQLESDSGDAK